MKQLFISLFIAFISFSPLHSMAQGQGWVIGFGGNAVDRSRAIEVDASGNVYTTGFFQNTADFDPGAGTSNMTAVGDHDIFVSKLDPSGNLLWARTFGSVDDDEGFDLSLDILGNVYVTGYFKGTVDFDPGPGVDNLTAAGGFDVFVVKLDAAGTYVWGKSFGAGFNDTAEDIKVTLTGEVYVLGNYHGVVDFDPGLGTTTLSGTEVENMYILKWNSAGNFVWVREIAGTEVLGLGLDTDPSGNVIIAGEFDYTQDFDPGVGVFDLTATGSQPDGFALKIDGSGNFVWAKQLEGATNNTILDVSSDPSGNVFLAGMFRGTVDFDPGVGTVSLASNGNEDAFILKLDALGDYQWAHNFGGTINDHAAACTTDALGDIYITGEYQRLVDFDPGIDSLFLDAGFGTHAYLSKFDATGNFVFAGTFGNNNVNNGYGVALNSSGDIFFTGVFRDSIDIDPGPGLEYLASTGASDPFVYQMRPCAHTDTTLMVTTCDSSYTVPSGANTYFSSGTYFDILPNAATCDSIISIVLTLTDIDTLVTVTPPNLISNDLAATHQWLNCDSGMAVVPGATSVIFTPPTTTGNYAVEITRNGCSDTSACYNLVLVSDNNDELDAQIQVFPNPSQGKFSVDLGKLRQNMTLNIRSVTGQLISTRYIEEADHLELEIDSPAGIYFLEIHTPGSPTFFHKVLKRE